VLIAVPLSEDKLFCFPSLVQCLKNLLATTNAKCTVAFALNDEDEGMSEAVKGCGIPHIIVPAERPDVLTDELWEQSAPDDVAHTFWIHHIALARNALREYAISKNYDWMFSLDSDTVIEPNAINKLLSYNLDLASVFVRHRESAENGTPNLILLYVGRGLGSQPYTCCMFHEEFRDLPSPIFNTFPIAAAGLIHRRVFTKIHYHFGHVPLQPGEEIGDPCCSSLGRWLSEDQFFAHDAASHGFTSVTCHKTKSIHFTDEDSYPKGASNRMKEVTYDEYFATDPRE